MQFFTYKHSIDPEKNQLTVDFTDRQLPESLQEVSKPFCELAEWVVNNLESNPETSTALRKLLEAKNAAVRAKLFKNENQ